MGGSVSRLEIGIEVLHERFESLGQGHVFRFWDRLSPGERQLLAEQCARIDLPGLLRALEAARARAEAPPPKLSPLPVERLPEHGGDASRFREAAQRGEELLRQGRVGLLLVAGGQGTRLGHPGPKGSFPLGPVTHRSLLELLAQKIRRLRARFGVALPWYVMTSEATDADTRAFFAARDHLGLPPGDVFFFRQGSVPSFDREQRLLLAGPGRLAENPDGHGGVLPALLESGALEDMERRGVDRLFYHQIDNPLVRMADPSFLGFHEAAEAEVSCKVVRKTDPQERVGVLARCDGRAGVVEYTELDPEQRFARDARGELVYWAGSIAIHVFDTAFVRRVAGAAERWLPFHVSEKRIPTVDAEGRPVEPSEPNGFKLERFVFDALPAARGVCVVEAARGREFSPVKNAEGEDSPETARRDLVAEYARWLSAAGLEIPDGAVLEVDHSRIDSPEDARSAGLRDLSETGDLVRIELGAEA